ncbi:hypothetical protein TGRUB_233315, partial [Toxoplasma gondii RUB]
FLLRVLSTALSSWQSEQANRMSSALSMGFCLVAMLLNKLSERKSAFQMQQAYRWQGSTNNNLRKLIGLTVREKQHWQSHRLHSQAAAVMIHVFHQQPETLSLGQHGPAGTQTPEFLKGPSCQPRKLQTRSL